MLTARRLLERREAAAAGKPQPAPQPPQLTEAEVLQARYRAKQEAARVEQLAKMAEPVAAPAATAAAEPEPESKLARDDKSRGDGQQNRRR